MSKITSLYTKGTVPFVYYPEVEPKEPMSLKGFARHLSEHGKLATYEMLVLVLQNIVSCMKELATQGQPVKLDGLGTFYPRSGGFFVCHVPVLPFRRFAEVFQRIFPIFFAFTSF